MRQQSLDETSGIASENSEKEHADDQPVTQEPLETNIGRSIRGSAATDISYAVHPRRSKKRVRKRATTTGQRPLKGLLRKAFNQLFQLSKTMYVGKVLKLTLTKITDDFDNQQAGQLLNWLG